MSKLQEVIHRNDRILIPKRLKVQFRHGVFVKKCNLTNEKCKKVTEKIVEFSFLQAEGKKQRPNLENSSYIRGKTQVFLDTLEGKAGELAFAMMYYKASGKHVEINLDSWDRGEYETEDFFINEKTRVQIKTAKQFSNIMMWPNANNSNKIMGKTDLLVFARTNIVEQSISNNNIKIINKYFLEEQEKITPYIINQLLNKSYVIEVVGFADKEMILDAINRKELLYKDEIIGKKPLRTNNNYILSIDLIKNIDFIF